MKKLIFSLVFGLVFCSVANAGGVQSDNAGNAGYVFVATGENHGKDSVGEWVDGSYFKGEKGDTGATGAMGPAGQDGLNGADGRNGVDGLNGTNGQDGQNGLDGQDGYTPVKGVDYVDGKDGLNGENGIDGVNGTNGINGQDGATGPQGEHGEVGLQGNTGNDGKEGTVGATGEAGKTGNDGKTPVKNVDYVDGKDGTEGKQGSQGLTGATGKGLKDRYELVGEVRLLDTKKTTWSIYAGRDINNDANIVGAKVVLKVGRSYEEKRLDALEKQMNSIVPSSVTTITKNAQGEIISMDIHDADYSIQTTQKF